MSLETEPSVLWRWDLFRSAGDEVWKKDRKRGDKGDCLPCGTGVLFRHPGGHGCLTLQG